MDQVSSNRSKRPAGPSRRPEARATYHRRRAVALGLVAVALVAGSKVASTEYKALTGTTVADRLEEPFDQAQAEFSEGKFSPGSVREVSLPNNVSQPAYDDALALTGSSAPESNIDEVYSDISAQQGDRPVPGSPVIVPKSDLRPVLQK